MPRICQEKAKKKPRNASNLRFKIQEIQLTFTGKPNLELVHFHSMDCSVIVGVIMAAKEAAMQRVPPFISH